MKKFLSVLILSAILIFSVQEKVFAYDVYCGTFKDGYQAYLMTETIHGQYEDFSCRVKAIKNNNVIYIDYYFYMENGVQCFRNSQGFTGVFVRGGNNKPVALAIYGKAHEYM